MMSKSRVCKFFPCIPIPTPMIDIDTKSIAPDTLQDTKTPGHRKPKRLSSQVPHESAEIDESSDRKT